MSLAFPLYFYYSIFSYKMQEKIRLLRQQEPD